MSSGPEPDDVIPTCLWGYHDAIDTIDTDKPFRYTIGGRK